MSRRGGGAGIGKLAWPGGGWAKIAHPINRTPHRIGHPIFALQTVVFADDREAESNNEISSVGGDGNNPQTTGRIARIGSGLEFLRIR